MNKKRRLLWKRLVAIGVFVILVWAARFGIRLYQANRFWHSMLTPRVHMVTSVAQLDIEQKREIAGQLGFYIPESARDIYFCMGGRDTHVFCSLTLPSKEIPKFAEEFAGAPISEFYEDFHRERPRELAERGPTFFGEKWKTPYWNLQEVKGGKYYDEPRVWKTGYVDSHRFIVVDLDTNRVYICTWST